MHAGYMPGRALLLNFFVACGAILGAVVALLIGSQYQQFVQFLIPVAAGGFIYVATADLIPEIRKAEAGLWAIINVFVLLLGLVIMYLLTFMG